MKRGFKSKSESLAERYRLENGLEVHDHLDPFFLARVLQVRVHPAEMFVTKDLRSKLLEGVGSRQWSAFTFSINSTTHTVYNDSHSIYRINSSLMHELAHVICEHLPYDVVGNGFLRQKYDKAQEDEADWLGGCLLIPRIGLIWSLKTNLSNDQIGTHFKVSQEMVRYRRNVTAVDRQLRSYKTTSARPR